MGDPFWFSDKQRTRLEPFFPKQTMMPIGSDMRLKTKGSRPASQCRSQKAGQIS